MGGQRGRCGPYATQYVQHSLTGTVQSSTRGLSSLVPPFPLQPHPPALPPFLPRCASRPLTFYHHNRYIIPRSVFYSRVTSWNAFVRDIVRSPSLLLLPPLVLFFPSFSFFFLRRLFDQREIVFFFFFDTVHFFGFDYDAEITGDYRERMNYTMCTCQVNKAFCRFAFLTRKKYRKKFDFKINQI